MIRAYDYYGSREADPRRVAELISAAARVNFTLRHSSYVGEYYHAKVARGQEITIEPNALPEAGETFVRWKEFAGYRTIVTVKQVLETGTELMTFLDEVQDTLRGVTELDFLRSKRPTMPR